MEETITEEELKEEGGGWCVFKDCRSSNVEFGAVLFDKGSGKCSQMGTCYECGRSWDEIFQIESFLVLDEQNEDNKV